MYSSSSTWPEPACITRSAVAQQLVAAGREIDVGRARAGGRLDHDGPAAHLLEEGEGAFLVVDHRRGVDPPLAVAAQPGLHQEFVAAALDASAGCSSRARAGRPIRRPAPRAPRPRESPLRAGASGRRSLRPAPAPNGRRAPGTGRARIGRSPSTTCRGRAGSGRGWKTPPPPLAGPAEELHDVARIHTGRVENQIGHAVAPAGLTRSAGSGGWCSRPVPPARDPRAAGRPRRPWY